MPSGVYIRTEEQKRHISQTLTGRRLTKEHSRHISHALTGRPFTEEHKRHISEVQAGVPKKPRRLFFYKKHPLTEEHKRHVSEALTGKHLTVEHKRHISEALKGKHYNIAAIGVPLTAEHRQHVSEAVKSYWRQRHIEKEAWEREVAAQKRKEEEMGNMRLLDWSHPIVQCWQCWHRWRLPSFRADELCPLCGSAIHYAANIIRANAGEND